MNRLFPRNAGLLAERYLDRPRDAPFDVEQPAAAALLVKRDVFAALKGFDPAFAPAWFEDVDLCARIRGARRADPLRPVRAGDARRRDGDERAPVPRLPPALHAEPPPLPLPARGRGGRALGARAVLLLGALLRLALLPFVRGDHARPDAAAAYGRVLAGLLGLGWRSALLPRGRPAEWRRWRVSLVTHNESRDVERLLPTLFAQTWRDAALVAVDNASEDGTRSSLAAFEKVTPIPMTVVPSRENLGYTGGHNARDRAGPRGGRGRGSSS